MSTVQKPSRFPLNRNAIMLTAAIALGGCSVYLANSYIDEEIANAKAAMGSKEQTVEVVVPARDLPKGVRIAGQDLAVRAVPAAYVDPNAVTESNYEVAVGQRLSFDVKQGKPLLWAHLEAGSTPTFSGKVPEGMRALTFPVDQVNSISGFLEPSDKIDLMLTYRPNKDEVTIPLLENVLVLATGQRTVVDKGRDGAEVERTYNTVTVQVSPENGQRIILAQETGKLTAVLRHPDDLSALSKKPMTVARLPGDLAGTPVRRSPVPSKVEEKKPGIQFIIGGL